MTDNDKVMKPYAMECENGKFQIVQAYDPGHALRKVREEYGLEPKNVKEVK